VLYPAIITSLSDCNPLINPQSRLLYRGRLPTAAETLLCIRRQTEIFSSAVVPYCILAVSTCVSKCDKCNQDAKPGVMADQCAFVWKASCGHAHCRLPTAGKGRCIICPFAVLFLLGSTDFSCVCYVRAASGRRGQRWSRHGDLRSVPLVGPFLRNHVGPSPLSWFTADLGSVGRVRERPPLVDEVSANFCG
jgi:hypothetical protein